MKKSIITLSLLTFALCGFSQKIGLKFKKQNVVVIPIQEAIAVLTDSVGVQQITDNGSSVLVQLGVGDRQRTLILWSGQAYKDNENWTNQMILDRIKVLLNIQ